MSTTDHHQPPPALGWTTPAEIARVIDGDTLEVTVTRTMRVRLLNCWAPETRTQNLAEKARGIDARNAMQEMVDQHGPTGVLFIPTGDGQQVADVFTFGRVLGRLWLPGVGELSAAMVEAGHAARAKE